MLHVGAPITGAGNPQNRVHISAIEIEQTSPRVDEIGNLADVWFENSASVRIGDHEHGDIVIELGIEIRHVDVSLDSGADCHRGESGHCGTGRVRTVSIIRSEHFGSRLAKIAKVGRRYEQRGQFTMGSGGRLQAAGGEPGDFLKDLLQRIQEFESSLQGFFGLIGMQVGHAGHSRGAFVPLGVVLHGARAERIEVGVDRHVTSRQVDEMSDDVRFRNFRQGRRVFVELVGREQLRDGNHGHVDSWQSCGAAAGA